MNCIPNQNHALLSEYLKLPWINLEFHNPRTRHTFYLQNPSYDPDRDGLSGTVANIREVFTMPPGSYQLIPPGVMSRAQYDLALTLSKHEWTIGQIMGNNVLLTQTPWGL